MKQGSVESLFAFFAGANHFALLYAFGEAGGVFQHFFAVVGIHPGQIVEHVDPLGFLKIGAPVKGSPVGQHKTVEGPATATGHELNRLHVQHVHIAAFFAVNFYIDKIAVHDGGYLGIFKTFVFHYVAPMASAVTNANEQGFVLFAGQGKGLVAKGQPLHRVVGVLQQVRTGFVNEAIGLPVGSCGHENFIKGK